VDKRLQNKNERAINKRNVDLIIAREEAKVKKRQMKDRTGNPKIDDPLEDFEKVYGYKFGSKFDEKIKAMKDGGDVPMPKRRPKDFKKTVEKQKKERAVAKGKVTVGGLNEMTDYDKEQFLKSKKMKLGGEATSNPPSKKKLTDKARDIIEKDKSENKMSSFSKVADMLTKQGFTGAAGEKGKVSATERRKKLNRDIFKGGQSKQVPQGMRVGGEAKPLVGNQFKLDKNKNGRIDGGDFAKMEMGGKVKEYGGGGKVKGGKMTCRGMGAAVKGGGFSIS